MVDMDGNIIKIGQFVGFKNGIENSGKVLGFRFGQVVVGVWNGDTGERDEVCVSPSRCWAE